MGVSKTFVYQKPMRKGDVQGSLNETNVPYSCSNKKETALALGEHMRTNGAQRVSNVIQSNSKYRFRATSVPFYEISVFVLNICS